MINNVAIGSDGFSVFAGVGERTREGNDLLREMVESKVIRYGDKFNENMQKTGEFDLELVDKAQLKRFEGVACIRTDDGTSGSPSSCCPFRV